MNYIDTYIDTLKDRRDEENRIDIDPYVERVEKKREPRKDIFANWWNRVKMRTGFGSQMVQGVNMRRLLKPEGGRKMFQKKMKILKGPGFKNWLKDWLKARQGFKGRKLQAVMRQIYQKERDKQISALKAAYRGKM